MRENRPAAWRAVPMALLLICLASCKVYTIDKSDLETRLNPRKDAAVVMAPSMNTVTRLYQAQFRNGLDTLPCADALGQHKTRRVNHDSKITIITHRKKSIRYYARSLYIYKNEFLVGERTRPSLHGPNYFAIKLIEISRIEVVGF